MTTKHQLKQQKIIEKVANLINNNNITFSTVSPIKDFVNDPRTCITSVHLPHKELLDKVRQTLIEPLHQIEPNLYFYPEDSLHLTIKSVRVVNNPPHFTENDIQKATEIFAKTIPQHKQFKVYFYRLLLFPNNLALIGTTEPELDSIFLDIDKNLKAAGIPDDKVYANSRYFFTNMTLCRFNGAPLEKFKQKIKELSDSLKFKPYIVDSITLLTCNAVLKNKHIRGTWQLK